MIVRPFFLTMSCSARALSVALTASTAMLPATAHAQAGAAERSFDIPAGPLAEALQAFSRRSGVQLVYSSELVAGKASQGARGTMSDAQALAQLLSGTGYTGSLSGNTATISAIAAAGEGERVTGAVRVEGVQGSPYFGGAGQAAGVNGINGSRDITATEGTGSFTSGALTVGSKMPQAMKDIPQSLSVLTSARMQQQNVTDFTTAMRQLPGVALVQGATSLETNFYSRGFLIRSIQVDGGAPMATGNSMLGDFYYPQIDMSVYDHVELIRGAAGLLNGYGDPSGTVNLVRKKPLDHAQYSVEAQAGSWNTYRIVADATSPLAFDGALRGRLVMTYQDNKHFYKIAEDNKTLIYGIAEMDVSPTTLLRVGANYTRQHSSPWSGGLPRYYSGEDLGLPRSTCLCFKWNRWDFTTTELFAGLEQKLGGEWLLKLDMSYVNQKDTAKLGYNQGGVFPESHQGPYYRATYRDNASKQFTTEATLSGAFTLFGQRQELTLGVNRSDSNGDGILIYQDVIDTYYTNPYQPYPGGPIICQDYGQGYCPPGSIASYGVPIDVFHFNADDPINSEPRNPLPYARFSPYGQKQWGAYLNLRLTAFDRLHLVTGFRWSRYSSNNTSDYLCTSIPSTQPSYTPNCYGKAIGDPYVTYVSKNSASNFSWPPPVSLSYDVTRSLTAYVGYTDIYESQANRVTYELKPLDPITGENWEAGLKWSARNGKLNVSVSAYRIKKHGFGTNDPDPTHTFKVVGPGVYCCYVQDPNRTQLSEGFDIDLTGEILSGWQVSASLTHAINRQDGSSFGNNKGKPFVTIAPKNLYKVWTSYDFGAAGAKGALAGLTASLGVNGQSSGFYSGSVCVNFKAPNPDGSQDCVSYDTPDIIEYQFTVPSYAVFSSRLEYRLSSIWNMSINVENIFDKKYYQTVGSDPSLGNWYGAPRSFTATVRAKW